MRRAPVMGIQPPRALRHVNLRVGSADFTSLFNPCAAMLNAGHDLSFVAGGQRELRAYPPAARR